MSLKIVAKADVSQAKASIRELTAEEANLLAKEKEHALASKQMAAEVAKARVSAARAAGTASKEELKEFQRMQRIAVADAKAAAKELTSAKRMAAGASRAELGDLVDWGQDRTRQNRKLAGGGKRKRNFLEGMEDLDEYGGAFLKRAIGPAAIIGALTAVVTSIRDAVAELKQIREGYAAANTWQR